MNVDDADVCATCGMGVDEWKGRLGLGVQKDHRNYCCEGCAEGTGCTCVKAPVYQDWPSGLSGIDAIANRNKTPSSPGG